MEIYKLSFQDTFLGTLMVDTVTGMYDFEQHSQYELCACKTVKRKQALKNNIAGGNSGRRTGTV